jgi:hypothetical protein
MIKNQNDHIAKLNAKIVEHELENKKFKFSRSMLYNGRHFGIKDDIGLQQGSNVKLNAPKRLSNFVKGKAPMVQDTEGCILYTANYPNIKLGRFMLGNLILFLIMHLCIKMRLLALGIPHMLKCLKKFLFHQMSIMFHLKLLMHHMFRQNSCQICWGQTRVQRLVFRYTRCLFLTSKDPRLFGYLRTRPKIVL